MLVNRYGIALKLCATSVSTGPSPSFRFKNFITQDISRPKLDVDGAHGLVQRCLALPSRGLLQCPMLRVHRCLSVQIFTSRHANTIGRQYSVPARLYAPQHPEPTPSILSDNVIYTDRDYLVVDKPCMDWAVYRPSLLVSTRLYRLQWGWSSKYLLSRDTVTES